MAQFYTYDFIYDGTPSQAFDLKIITFESGGLFDGIGSSDVNILSQRVLRKSKPYYLGRTQEPVLEFPLTFGTARPISGIERDRISAWLFGRSGYKKLYILQDDLNGAYFNCFFTEPKPKYIGGINYAFTSTIMCDSPWAYGAQRIISGSSTSTEINLDIYNYSTEDEYLYPTIYIKYVNTQTGLLTDECAIFVNNTDNSNRVTSFSYLCANDEITLDNDLQIITLDNIDTTYFPFPRQFLGVTYANTIIDCFNKNWFRLLPDNNNITIENPFAGTLTYEIRLTERFKIGG